MTMPDHSLASPIDVSSVQVAPRAGETAHSVMTRASKRRRVLDAYCGAPKTLVVVRNVRLNWKKREAVVSQTESRNV